MKKTRFARRPTSSHNSAIIVAQHGFFLHTAGFIRYRLQARLWYQQENHTYKRYVLGSDLFVHLFKKPRLSFSASAIICGTNQFCWRILPSSSQPTQCPKFTDSPIAHTTVTSTKNLNRLVETLTDQSSHLASTLLCSTGQSCSLFRPCLGDAKHAH
jgi:hypothetical protein